MTNKERIFSMSTNDCVTALEELFSHPLKPYIDYGKYFDSDDPDVISALAVLRPVKYRPSEAAIKAFENEHADAENLQELVDKYISDNTEDCLLLSNTHMFDQIYCVVYKPDDKSFFKTPSENIIENVY